MGIVAWIFVGLIAGFLASKVVNRSGEGFMRDILLGIVGAIVGGWISQYQNHIEFALLRVGHGDGEVQNGNAGDGCRRHDSEDAEKFSSLLKQRF